MDRTRTCVCAAFADDGRSKRSMNVIFDLIPRRCSFQQSKVKRFPGTTPSTCTLGAMTNSSCLKPVGNQTKRPPGLSRHRLFSSDHHASSSYSFLLASTRGRSFLFISTLAFRQLSVILLLLILLLDSLLLSCWISRAFDAGVNSSTAAPFNVATIFFSNGERSDTREETAGSMPRKGSRSLHIYVQSSLRPPETS